MTLYPDSFALVEIHINDAYENSWCLSRASWYGVYYSGGTGLPTSWFDGWIQRVGAAVGVSYTTEYASAAAVPTDVTIELFGDHVGPADETFEISAEVCIEAGGTGKTMRLQLVQVLDDYPAGDYHNCLMQGAAYEDITLAPEECAFVERTFTFDAASWANQDDIRIIAWVHEISPGQDVYQAAQMSMPFPPPFALKLDLPDIVPEYIPSYETTDITIQIEDGRETYVPDSGLLHYRYDGGTFLTASLTSLGGDLYEATLPAPECDDTPEFYISAEGDEGATVYLPEDAPTSVFTTTVGNVATILDDDFETDQNWSVENVEPMNGSWERGVPIDDGTEGDPLTDYDGSGQCYLTENVLGNSDVDNGPTRLISPTMDLSGTSDPILRYARWFRCDDPVGSGSEDYLDVEISDDGGGSWTPVESVSDVEGWVVHDVSIASFVSLSSQFKVRFVTEDNPNNSKVEAAIDAVKVFDVTCVDCQVGDIDCSGELDDVDVSLFVGVLVGTETTQSYIDRSNLNGDGVVDGLDIEPFVGAIVP